MQSHAELFNDWQLVATSVVDDEYVRVILDARGSFAHHAKIVPFSLAEQMRLSSDGETLSGFEETEPPGETVAFYGTVDVKKIRSFSPHAFVNTIEVDRSVERRTEILSDDGEFYSIILHRCRRNPLMKIWNTRTKELVGTHCLNLIRFPESASENLDVSWIANGRVVVKQTTVYDSFADVLYVVHFDSPSNSHQVSIVPSSHCERRRIEYVRLSGDGRTLVYSTARKICMRDSRTGNCIAKLDIADDDVQLALNLNYLAVRSTSFVHPAVSLYDVRTGDLVRSLTAPNDIARTCSFPYFSWPTSKLKFSPDGTKLVTLVTAEDNAMLIVTWRVTDGQCIDCLRTDAVANYPHRYTLALGFRWNRSFVSVGL